MIDMLAQPIGAEHEAAGPEGPLMQALDRLRVVRPFGKDGEGEIAHGSGIASGAQGSMRARSALADRRLREVGEQLHLAPTSRHGVKHQSG